MNSFYEELFKQLSSENEIITENVCLITNQPLEDGFITLECKHTFNYHPIYQEIVRQKYNEFRYETQRVSRNQLKCPYCRNIQNTILPPPKEYFDNNDDSLLLTNVNFPFKWCMTPNICDYVYKSGKKKGEKCGTKCFQNHCNTHINILKKREKTRKRKKQPSIYYCSTILSSGKKKGEVCGIKSKHNIDGIHYCGRHKPKT